MLIRFLENVELEVVDSYDDENDVAETTDVTFQKNQTALVDVLEVKKDTVDVQFGDGSCCYGLNRSCFKVEQLEYPSEKALDL